MTITPWEVRGDGGPGGGIDYRRVREVFKAEEVPASVNAMLQQCSSNRSSSSGDGSAGALPLHHFFSRRIAFAHRDFDEALREVAAMKEKRATQEETVATPAFLYTGRGPSAASMHLGHAIPFLLTRYLQRALDLPVVIQISDDEKFLFRDVPFAGCEAEERVTSNIRDILAFGFDPQRTFVFRNTEYIGHMYGTVLALQRAFTTNAVSHTLGLTPSDSVGQLAYAATQAAPCFYTAFPEVLGLATPRRCIVPCAVDQDPFFVLARRASRRVQAVVRGGLPTAGKQKGASVPPPATVYTTFLQSLKGPSAKMSSSHEAGGVIHLSDNAETVARKVRKAYSGGAATLAELEKRVKEGGASGGAAVNLNVDVGFQLLRFFSANDDLVKDVEERYVAGKVNSGEVKALAAKVVNDELLAPWRRRRESITVDVIKEFSRIRPIV